MMSSSSALLAAAVSAPPSCSGSSSATTIYTAVDSSGSNPAVYLSYFIALLLAGHNLY